MSIDWPHMIISILLIFATVLLVHRAPAYKQGSRGKRAVIVALAFANPPVRHGKHNPVNGAKR